MSEQFLQNRFNISTLKFNVNLLKNGLNFRIVANSDIPVAYE